MLNLVKNVEKRPRESLLYREFSRAISYVNQQACSAVLDRQYACGMQHQRSMHVTGLSGMHVTAHAHSMLAMLIWIECADPAGTSFASASSSMSSQQPCKTARIDLA